MGATNIYFTDFFDVSPVALEEYGAFDVSLIGDLPLFVDPFLLFNSENPTYQALHGEIIRYMRFLKDVTLSERLTEPLVSSATCWRSKRQRLFFFLGNRIGND